MPVVFTQVKNRRRNECHAREPPDNIPRDQAPSAHFKSCVRRCLAVFGPGCGVAALDNTKAYSNRRGTREAKGREKLLTFLPKHFALFHQAILSEIYPTRSWASGSADPYLLGHLDASSRGHSNGRIVRRARRSGRACPLGDELGELVEEVLEA